MTKPYQLQYQEIFNDPSLPSIQSTLKIGFNQQNQGQLFPIAQSYPQFFNQNLVSDKRIIKHATGQQAILRCFYYQLFKLCFQIQNQNNDYLQVMKEILFDKQFFYQSKSIISKSSNNSASRVSKKSSNSNKNNKQRKGQQSIRTRTNKKYLCQFIEKIIESRQNFEDILNKYKIIDAIILQFLQIFLENCQEQLQSVQQILDFLCQIFQINLISFDNLFKFQQSDVYVYLQSVNNQLEVYMAFTEIQQQSQIRNSSFSQNSSKLYDQQSNKNQLNNTYKKNLYQNQSQSDHVITSQLKNYQLKNNQNKISEKIEQIQTTNIQNRIVAKQEVKKRINFDQNNTSVSQLPTYTSTNFAVATNPFHKKQNFDFVQEQKAEKNSEILKNKVSSQHQLSPKMSASNADTIMNMLADTIKSNQNIQASISSVTNLKNLNGSQVFGHTGGNSFGSQIQHKNIGYGVINEQNTIKNKINNNENEEVFGMIKMKKQIKSDSYIKQNEYDSNRLKAITKKKEIKQPQQINVFHKNKKPQYNIYQQIQKTPNLTMEKQNSQVINQWIKENLQPSEQDQNHSAKNSHIQNQNTMEQQKYKPERINSHHSNSSKIKLQNDPQIKISSVSSEDSDNYQRNNYYTQDDNKQQQHTYHFSKNNYAIGNSYQPSSYFSKKQTSIKPVEQTKFNNFNQSKSYSNSYKINSSYQKQDQIFFKPANSKYKLNTINEVTASKQTNRDSYKPQNDQNSLLEYNQDKIKIQNANSIFYGQQTQKQKQYLRSLARNKQQKQEQSKGTFYKQFSDSKILKLLKQPYKTKVQILKNRFKGQHRLNILKN